MSNSSKKPQQSPELWTAERWHTEICGVLEPYGVLVEKATGLHEGKKTLEARFIPRVRRSEEAKGNDGKGNK